MADRPAIDIRTPSAQHGWMEHPDGHARLHGECGDDMEMWLVLAGDRVHRIAYTTTGCGASHAAASMATVLAIGRTLEEALRLTPQEVLEALGGLPPGHEHCAELAAATVQLVVEDAMLRRLRPARPATELTA